MRFPKIANKILYPIVAVAVGVGCLDALIFFLFHLDDGLLSEDNKPAAFGVAALAIVGTIGFLYLGKFIYKSTAYVGPIIGVIIFTAICTPAAIEMGSNAIANYHKYRAQPYLERYMEELKTTFAEKAPSVDYDYTESKSETLEYWAHSGEDIRVRLTKRDRTPLSREDLTDVMDAVPPSNYDVRVFIRYGSNQESQDGRFSMNFVVPQKPANWPPYCDSNNYESDPCDFVNGLVVNRGNRS